MGRQAVSNRQHMLEVKSQAAESSAFCLPLLWRCTINFLAFSPSLRQLLTVNLNREGILDGLAARIEQLDLAEDWVGKGSACKEAFRRLSPLARYLPYSLHR